MNNPGWRKIIQGSKISLSLTFIARADICLDFRISITVKTGGWTALGIASYVC
jgi:hypothetical protein